MSMPMRIFTPKTEVPKVGLVYYNHFGASIYEDAGRDAMLLAEALNVIVMAVDRPGSGYSLPIHGKRLQQNYIGEITKQGKIIDAEANRMGLNRIVASGRSAGGLAALALARTQTSPVVGVTAKEPVGMYDTTVSEGREAHTAYKKWQTSAHEAAKSDPYSRLVLPEKTDRKGLAVARRALSIAYCAPADQLNNKGVWSQDIGRETALYLAENMPHVRTELLFAADSMVASSRQIGSLAMEGMILRANATIEDDDNRQPFTVRTLPHTTHASFDLRSFYQQQDERFLDELNTATQ